MYMKKKKIEIPPIPPPPPFSWELLNKCKDRPLFFIFKVHQVVRNKEWPHHRHKPSMMATHYSTYPPWKLHSAAKWRELVESYINKASSVALFLHAFSQSAEKKKSYSFFFSFSWADFSRKIIPPLFCFIIFFLFLNFYLQANENTHANSFSNS